MKTIDVLGKPCPIPVIEAKKALNEQGEEAVLVKVDNIVAVQNLEKMAKGYGFGFSYAEQSKDSYEVKITKGGSGASMPAPKPVSKAPQFPQSASPSGASPSKGFVVAVGRNTMGEGAEELGKVLIKGFIYSLSELPVPPEFLLFFNSGAYLTSEGANTVDDLKKLERNGTKIFTCGTCVNYFELQGKLAVGAITDMYGIADKMAAASSVINI